MWCIVGESSFLSKLLIIIARFLLSSRFNSERLVMVFCFGTYGNERVLDCYNSAVSPPTREDDQISTVQGFVHKAFHVCFQIAKKPNASNGLAKCSTIVTKPLDDG